MTPQATITQSTEEFRDSGTWQDTVAVERRGGHAALCRWTISGFTRAKARALWSSYFAVGGYDCRLLIYPKGDAQALPGYLSIYLQIMDPRGPSSSSGSGSSNKWDCFTSYRISIVNHADDSKSVHRDSWHRFSSKKKSHGWCDFTPSAPLFDSKCGFLTFPNDSIVLTADILVLDEAVSFTRGDGVGEMQALGVPSDVLTGKFTWKVKNFSFFRDMINTHKIMSPVFPVGNCNLRISVYHSTVGGVEHLSMSLESKDVEKAPDRSCWCLFRMSVLNHRSAGSSGSHVHRDSYGRFAADNKGGDNTSLGWNDFMRMSDFFNPESGYLVDDTAVFTMSFHVIKELGVFSKNVIGMSVGRGLSGVGGQRKSDAHCGKFTWRIENFTKLKDLLKKRKMTGLCVKSKRFQIGNRDCRLIVYPRGQSQPPCHLSVFLEVTDSRDTSNNWSCFVSHRLSVVNQKTEEKSVSKESQNRYSKSSKDWGWREFVTLTSLFDQDSGFLVQDTVVFAAEVLILKESFILQEYNNEVPESRTQTEAIVKKGSFTWKVENFLYFKEIMETRKIFSKFFQACGCELRIGVYESFETICIYLESDQSAGSDSENNFWVRYRMAVVNQRNSAKTLWKESSICTKTWNSSVLQFMKVSDMLEMDAGYLARDTIVFICEIIDCCPWFEFSDLEVWASEDEQDVLSSGIDDLVDSEDTEGICGNKEDIFQNFLSRAGFHLSYGSNFSQPQVTLSEQLLIDFGDITKFLSSLRVYLDDPAKVKHLLLPAKLSSSSSGKKDSVNCNSTHTSSPSPMDLLLGVNVLQQGVVELLLDLMVECCQPSDEITHDASDVAGKHCPDNNRVSSPPDSSHLHDKLENAQFSMYQRLDAGVGEKCSSNAVQSSDSDAVDVHARDNIVHSISISPPDTSATGFDSSGSFVHSSKNKWPEHSEELIGLILNSLRSLDGTVPQGCLEPQKRSQLLPKIALLLDKIPRHLFPDLLTLVPKLVDHSEHSLAACILLDCIQINAEPALRLSVFGVLSQLEVSDEVSKCVLDQTFELLKDSNDEFLVEVVCFIFKTAAQCQHLPQAVRAVRSRLKCLDMDVPQCVLDILSKTVLTCADIAEEILRDIDSDFEVDENCTSKSFELLSNPPNEISLGEESSLHGCCPISDVYILLDMLSLPSIFPKVSQVFGKLISRGVISLQLFAMILDRRHLQRLGFKSSFSSTEDTQNTKCSNENSNLPSAQEDDFTSVLSLSDMLSLSLEPRVHDFVRMLYAIMFKIYFEEHYRIQMIKRLVDHVTSSSDNCRMVDIYVDVLTFLIHEEDGVARTVINMMREICELAHVDRATLWHQVCSTEDENIRAQDEKKELVSKISQEKDDLSKRLNESMTTVKNLKTELRSEADHFAWEKRELSERIIEIENQIDWVRSERDEETTKLSSDKKILQDRLYDAEAQIVQLNSRKRDELKKAAKEKATLTEKLKNAEASRKRIEEEMKRFSIESVTREDARQSLEDEVRSLKQTVVRVQEEKREKEEQVSRCEAYIDIMQPKLQSCQEYICSLEASLREEMSRHAPLYGAGLNALSMQELETISRIHEDGLMQIRSICQMKAISSNTIAHSHGSSITFPSSHSQPMTDELPSLDTQTDHSILNSMQTNSCSNITPRGSWFNTT